MGNQLSQALAAAGLVSQQSVEKQAAREIVRTQRRQRKQFHRMELQTREAEVRNFSSPSEFLEAARQRLKEQGYSEGLMNEIFREAHAFADAKLEQKKRGKMHAFLCQLKERLVGETRDRQQRILRDGRRAFAQMNVNKLPN